MRFEGACLCGKVKFSLGREPLIVHACHCTQCQRIAGSAFVMNALIEKSEVTLDAGELAEKKFDGTGHTVFFCQACSSSLWSQYGDASSPFWYVRVGTLKERNQFPPDVHIFTSTKQPWVRIPEGVPVFQDFYDRSEVWSEASLERLKAVTSG